MICSICSTFKCTNLKALLEHIELRHFCHGFRNRDTYLWYNCNVQYHNLSFAGSNATCNYHGPPRELVLCSICRHPYRTYKEYVGCLKFHQGLLLAFISTGRGENDSGFIPTEYKIKLRVLLDDGPNAKKITSDGLPIPGSVTIRGHPSHNTSIIKLDVKDLQIKSVNVSRLERAADDVWRKHPIGVRSLQSCKSLPLLSGGKKAAEKELLAIETEEELRTGVYYEVGVEYVAKCKKYTYTGSGLIGVLEAGSQNTMSRWLLWTKLGRRDASRVFPCVNDPAIRAKMELEVVHRPGYTVVSHHRPSNSGEAKWEAANNGTIIHHTIFPKTVPLPLYSFGVVIGALERRTFDFGAHRQALNIYWPKHESTDEESEESEFNQELMVGQTSEHIKEMIDFLQGQLGSDNVTNLELAMIDESFYWNSGTYHGLIISPRTNILKRRTLTEEQWLLTLTDNMGSLLPRLWLGGTAQVMYMNDAISRFLYYGMLQAVGFTDWKVDSIMLRDMRRIAFTLKSAVSFEDAEVAQSGKLALEEKAALMRLLEDVLTAHSTGDKLRLTFRQYASIYWEREPTLGDFAGALEQAMATTIPPHSNGSHQAVGGPVGWKQEDMVAPSFRAVLDFWLNQTGYPLVQVEDLAGNSTNLAISQVKYKQEAQNSSLWPIPVSIVSADNPTWKPGFHHLWLQTSGTPLLKQHDSSKWVLLNYNVTAFYRTLYKGVYFENIKAQLVADLHKIPPLSRGQLWDDYFNFVDRGHVDYPSLLSLTAYLEAEDSPAVWSHFLTHFKKLVLRFSSHPRFTLLKSYFKQKLDGGLKSVGMDVALDALSFDGSDNLLPRESLFNWACRLGALSCESYAKGLLAKFQEDPEAELIPANLPKNAVCDILCAVTAATKDTFLVTGGGGDDESIFGSAALAARGCPVTALACAVDPGVIRALLAEALKNDTFQTVRIMTFMDQVIDNPQGRPLFLDWLSEIFKAAMSKEELGGVDFIAAKVLRAAEYWSTQEQLTKLEQFAARHKTDIDGGKEATKFMDGARAIIRKNMEWMNKDGHAILGWLEAHQ